MLCHKSLSNNEYKMSTDYHKKRLTERWIIHCDAYHSQTNNLPKNAIFLPIWDSIKNSLSKCGSSCKNIYRPYHKLAYCMTLTMGVYIFTDVLKYLWQFCILIFLVCFLSPRYNADMAQKEGIKQIKQMARSYVTRISQSSKLWLKSPLLCYRIV